MGQGLPSNLLEICATKGVLEEVKTDMGGVRPGYRLRGMAWWLSGRDQLFNGVGEIKEFLLRPRFPH